MTKLPLNQPFDFKQWERMIVLPHIHPDGDTLGSSVALREFFALSGLETYIVNDDRIPANLCFLNTEGFIRSEEFFSMAWDDGSYAVIVVDGSDLTRIADRMPIYEKASAKLCVDHHVTNTEFADYLWLEPDASSTGELVYQMLRANDCTITPTMAEAIYVAISTDTGSFKYDNTTATTMRTVADLIETGFDMQKVIVEVYQNKEYDQVKLMQIALNHLRLEFDGKVGITYITAEDVEKNGIEKVDTDGICEAVRDISGLEVAIFLREVSPGSFKASTRSKHDFNVATFSLAFGGGGHKKAAGFTLNMSIDSAIQTILEALKGQVSS